MARSNSEIEAIIAGLKTARDTRDAAIETAAAALDDSDAANAARLRSLNHAVTKAADVSVCVACVLKKDSTGKILAMQHTSFDIEDQVDFFAGANVTRAGLKSLLVDESFTVTGATTVENL